MNLILLFDRVKNKILKTYREYVFFKRTGYRVNIVKNLTLINTNLKIGHNVTIYPDVMFFGDGLIEIGDNVDIGNGTLIYASKKGGVYIGSNTMIAAQSYIVDTDHGTEVGQLMRRQPDNANRIYIGEDVWVAANCTILRGSVINSGAVIGAKSLVKGTINKNSVAVGIPAKHIKFRGE